MQRRFTAVSVSGAIAVFMFATLYGQQPPTFRTGTTLVEISVVVLTEDGAPVTDLTKDDLVLTERGRPRDIAFFRFDGDAPAVSSTPQLPPPTGFVTNRHTPERNAVAVVLDLVNIPLAEDPFGNIGGQLSVRSQILEYLNALPSNTYTSLFRVAELEPLETLQPFTTDVDAVRSKVTSLKLSLPVRPSVPTGRTSRLGGGLGAEARAAEARALADLNVQIAERGIGKTLASLEAIGTHLAGIPGRKSLIWISNGIPTALGDGGIFVSYEKAIRHTAQRLANQGVAVYPVMAAGLPVIRRNDHSEVAGFNIVADITGGRVVRDNNDLTRGMTLAAVDQRGTYELGFYVPDEGDDAWHSIKVDVKRAGVSVRHREGHLAPRRERPQNWLAKSWNSLAYQPLDSTGIRLNARSDVARNRVVLQLEVAAADVYFYEKTGQTIADLEIGLVEIGRNGPTNVRQQPLEITRNTPPQPIRDEMIPVKTTWPLNGETKSVRAIVRDRFTGRYGTLEMPLNGR